MSNELPHQPLPPEVHDPYAALRVGSFRLYITGNFLAVLGFRMQTVAIGYEINERTGSPLALGLVGLVQILPVLFLALIAGHVADRLDRKRIVLVTLGLIAISALCLMVVSLRHDEIWIYYLLLFVMATARAFQQPAKSSLLPQIVDRDDVPNAMTWGTSTFQLAIVVGPAVGGLLLAVSPVGPAVVYACHALSVMVFFVMLLPVKRRKVIPTTERLTLDSLLSGLRFVGQQKVMLGAITLDLFAVLLGGAAALYPVYAKQILEVGPTGLGWMEAAPAAGAVALALVIAHRPPMERAGQAMLWSVAGFGATMIVFGLSRSFPLSLAMLFLSGALDSISVVVRHTLVQLLTPDEMRGRVSAINGLFIGASNELGGFESGLVAHYFGTTFSVVSGGVGTLLVVMCLAVLNPALRMYGRLGEEKKSDRSE